MQKMQERGLQFLIEKVTWNKRWQLAPVFLAGKSHGQRTREGYSPQCHKESDLTEYIQTHIKVILNMNQISVLLLKICKYCNRNKT